MVLYYSVNQRKYCEITERSKRHARTFDRIYYKPLSQLWLALKYLECQIITADVHAVAFYDIDRLAV
jgi:hypothetical protein